MMNFEIFKKVVEEKFLGYMPEEYQKSKQVVLRPVQKTNVELCGLTLINAEGSTTVSPTLYVEYMYEDYKRSEDLDAVLARAANSVVEAIDNMPKHINGGNLKFEKENIFFQVINAEKNKELLKTIPHKMWNDLAIVYRHVFDIDERGIQSALLTHNLCKSTDFDEDELHDLAIRNTLFITPPSVRPMEEVLRELLPEDLPDEIADEMIGEFPIPMILISNKYGINGAGMMLYTEHPSNIANKFDDDLYILPSSLHEVICVPASAGDPKYLLEMVREINASEVSEEDLLSDSVYFFDRKTEKITLVEL